MGTGCDLVLACAPRSHQARARPSWTTYGKLLQLAGGLLLSDLSLTQPSLPTTPPKHLLNFLPPARTPASQPVPTTPFPFSPTARPPTRHPTPDAAFGYRPPGNTRRPTYTLAVESLDGGAGGGLHLSTPARNPSGDTVGSCATRNVDNSRIAKLLRLDFARTALETCFQATYTSVLNRLPT